MSRSDETQGMVTRLSRWVDEAPCNAGRNPEAHTWHRVAKVSEEAGEAVGALIIATGSNPRKQNFVGDYRAVVVELLDTALAALGAIEHIEGNSGVAMTMLHEHAQAICVRAGVLR